ncbi:MAG: ABC transporter permease [Candidatus Acidiferrales bacterium]
MAGTFFADETYKGLWVGVPMKADPNHSDIPSEFDALKNRKAGGFFEGLAQDLTFALRQLRRSPGFAAVAVLTLALGIGANTAILTLINTVMLTRLPVGHPEELVLLHWVSHSQGPYVWNSSSSYGGCDTYDPGSGNSNCSFSFPDFDNFRSHAHSFQGMAAFGGGIGVQVDMNGQATRANGQYVSGEYFSVLEVRPAYGRGLAPADDVPGAVPTVVLDFNYWQKQFNGDPKVVGGSILFNSVPFTIAGIAPAEFYGISPGGRPNFWIPLHTRDRLGTKSDPKRYEARTIWLYIVGRLKPGVSPESARAETEVMYRRSLANVASAAAKAPTKYEKEHSVKSFDTDLSIALTSAERGLANLRQRYSTQLFVLMAAAGLVLLIACANIANLLLARAAARRKEIAVRLAIGASRWRLLRQLLTESLLLAFLGCAAGLLVSYWASRGLVLVIFSARASAAFMAMFRPNFVVFGYAVAMATFASILFGLIPALTSTRVSPGATLKAAGGAGSGAPSESRNRLGRALVAVEMALALVLVIGAGLFLRTLVTLETLDPGFRTDHLLTFSISPSSAKIPDEKAPALGQELQRRLAALPGVESVTWSGDLLLSGNLWTTDAKIQEHPEAGELETQEMSIGPRYFETLKIPLLTGRTISVEDCRKNFPGIWVNHAFATKFLKNANPVGLHILQDDKPLEIMGMVGDVKYQSVRDDFSPTIYSVMPGGDSAFQVRTASNPRSLQNAVRKIVSEVAPNIPLEDMGTLQEEIDSNLASENSMARLSSGFGFLALLLAAIGIYGVLAYSVSRRTGEIAIRMSLGAMPGNILGLILREGLAPTLIGAGVGLVVSWGITRLVVKFLYGVKPLDLTTFSVATFVLLLIAVLACVIPARRAMRVAPMTALRYE